MVRRGIFLFVVGGLVLLFLRSRYGKKVMASVVPPGPNAPGNGGGDPSKIQSEDGLLKGTIKGLGKFFQSITR